MSSEGEVKAVTDIEDLSASNFIFPQMKIPRF